jgi:N-acetylglucosamine kinase-like BadF-type ATPase
MNSYFLGIDIGATKTDALVTGETGQALGFGRTGPGNQQTVGYSGMASAIREATSQALSMAGLSIEQIAGAGFGIAGYDWPSQRPQMLATIRQALEMRAPVAISNDAVLGLLAGTDAGWGVALVAGTSNNCRGRDPHGREGRVTGDGNLFGEYGGAAEMADKALHAVAAAWSCRGPATRLSDALVAHLGARDVDDLLEGLALGRYHLGADAAPLVFQVARTGDAVAQEVIAWAGRELGDLAVGVIRQLGFEQLSFDVVLMGSLFNGGTMLGHAVRTTIHAVAPAARIKRLTAPPVVGAVLLGVEQAGLDPTPARSTLIRATAEMLSASQSRGETPTNTSMAGTPPTGSPL